MFLCVILNHTEVVVRSHKIHQNKNILYCGVRQFFDFCVYVSRGVYSPTGNSCMRNRTYLNNHPTEYGYAHELVPQAPSSKVSPRKDSWILGPQALVLPRVLVLGLYLYLPYSHFQV